MTNTAIGPDLMKLIVHSAFRQPRGLEEGQYKMVTMSDQMMHQTEVEGIELSIGRNESMMATEFRIHRPHVDERAPAANIAGIAADYIAAQELPADPFEATGEVSVGIDPAYGGITLAERDAATLRLTYPGDSRIDATAIQANMAAVRDAFGAATSAAAATAAAAPAEDTATLQRELREARRALREARTARDAAQADNARLRRELVRRGRSPLPSATFNQQSESERAMTRIIAGMVSVLGGEFTIPQRALDAAPREFQYTIDEDQRSWTITTGQ